jgi:hypothetical protein
MFDHAELADRGRLDTRYLISSATVSASRAAQAVRGHWQIEDGLHWALDVTFGEDHSRLRKGHGATNMAFVRHFAFNLLRKLLDKRSIQRRRKMQGGLPNTLKKSSASYLVNLDFEALDEPPARLTSNKPLTRRAATGAA